MRIKREKRRERERWKAEKNGRRRAGKKDKRQGGKEANRKKRVWSELCLRDEVMKI